MVALYADEDDDPEIITVSLAAARAGDDPRQILAYLVDLGIAVIILDDLLAINDVEDEEDLFAFRCREGVAISVASDGAWILYVP